MKGSPAVPRHRTAVTGLVLAALASATGACSSGASGPSAGTPSTTTTTSAGLGGPFVPVQKGGPGVDSAARTITLGDITALSGAQESTARPLDAGYKAYIDYVNAKGGVDGWKVAVRTVDDASTPSAHLAAYNKLVGGVAFVGESFGSRTTAAIEAGAQQAGVLVGTAAQDSAFVAAPVNLVIGTPYSVDVTNGLYYLTQVLGKKSAKIGIVYQNDPFGQDGLKGYVAGEVTQGFPDVVHSVFDLGQTSFADQARALKASGASYVVVTATSVAAAGLIRSAAAIGYSPRWILQGPAWSEYLMTSTGTPSGAPTAAEPDLVGAWVLGFEARWGDTSVPGMSRFLAVQQQYAPTQPPDYYFMFGYCLAEIETAILHKAILAHDLSRAGILTAKQHLGAYSWGGLIPDARYTTRNGPASRQTIIDTVSLTSTAFLAPLSPGFVTSPAVNRMSFPG